MLPTSTDVTIALKPSLPANAPTIAAFIIEGADGAGLPPEVAESVARLVKSGAHSGKASQVTFDLVETANGKFRRVYLVGLGRADKLDAEVVRKAAGHLAKALRKHKQGSVAIIPPENFAAAVVTAILLRSFDYREYQGAGRKKDDEKQVALNVSIIGPKSLQSEINRAVAIGSAQNYARTIASRPGNNINPPSLAKVAQEMAKESGLSCRVMDEKELARLKMGGILAVGSGSQKTPPRMIVLEWKGSRVGRGIGKAQGSVEKITGTGTVISSSLMPLLLVGKAITFDTGGISIKPADKMGDMIYDKCGGMAVLGAMLAIARLKLPVHVVGILSSAENHISETAYRPGDIVRMHNGVTVEVTNTDAEGRLVLGDALAWGIETFKPAAVIDLATLTGGVVVALGESMAGCMCNDDALFNEISHAAGKTGEKLWRLPLAEEVREQIKSQHADIVNSAGRHASPLQGSAFLSFFIPDGTAWAHLDIAGVADTDKELPYYGKGATGWGVRTLVEWVERRSNRF
jgi:leucyl aminopeptidase